MAFSSDVSYVRITLASLRLLYDEPDLAKRAWLLSTLETTLRSHRRAGKLDWDGYVDPGHGGHASWTDLLEALIDAEVLDPSVDWVSRALHASQAACVLDT